jgi:hypothetical protein
LIADTFTLAVDKDTSFIFSIEALRFSVITFVVGSTRWGWNTGFSFSQSFFSSPMDYEPGLDVEYFWNRISAEGKFCWLIQLELLLSNKKNLLTSYTELYDGEYE